MLLSGCLSASVTVIITEVKRTKWSPKLQGASAEQGTLRFCQQVQVRQQVKLFAAVTKREVFHYPIESKQNYTSQLVVVVLVVVVVVAVIVFPAKRWASTVCARHQ